MLKIVSWLAKKLMIGFAAIAIILITIISIVLGFSLTTVLIRVFAGSLIFSIIGGLLGEIIFRNIESNNVSQNMGQNIDEIVDESGEEGASDKPEDSLDSEELDEGMEPLEFEDLNDKDDNVINNIDGEQGAEIIREMSQDN